MDLKVVMDPKHMRQWTGEFDGTNTGKVTINIEYDENIDNAYVGTLHVTDSNTGLPNLIGDVSFNDSGFFKGHTSSISVEDPRTGYLQKFDDVKDYLHPDLIMPKVIYFDGREKNGGIQITWQTDIGTKGEAYLTTGDFEQKSSLESETLDWSQFKSFLDEIETEKYIYRGQSKPRKLRTKFHRYGRCNLKKYLNQDIPELNRYAAAVYDRRFNVDDADEFTALLALAQHHGYPTPLLDWTKSPYIASFFAFKENIQDAIDDFDTNSVEDETKVRIFLFRYKDWCKDNNIGVDQILSPHQKISVHHPLPLLNKRVIPQQAISTFTNVDDIESFIERKSNENSLQYLIVRDVLYSWRDDVLRELDMMGINSATLFPGFDGICDYLTEKNFFELG